MKIEYDAQVDIMYIELRDAYIEESDEVASGVIVDYDKNGVRSASKSSTPPASSARFRRTLS